MVKKIVENIVYCICAIFLLWVLLSWMAILLSVDNSYNFFTFLLYTYEWF